MSVHQTAVTELNTQSSAIRDEMGSLNPLQLDKKGTVPIRLDPVQTYRLRFLFLTSTYLRMANEEMKNMLFTHPFDVFLGSSEENVLDQTFKESVVTEYWMTALKKIHDWLIQFGIAPYIIRPIVLPSISAQFDIAEFKKASLSKTKGGTDENRRNEENEEVREKEGQSEKEHRAADDIKDHKVPNIMTPSDKPQKKSGGSKPQQKATKKNMNYIRRGEELHYVIDVPEYDSGFISTYIDHESKQRFLWTWYPNAVPQSFDNRNGYTDAKVKFIVKDAPTIRGEYTCPLRTAIKPWLYLNSRKKMDGLSMRDRLNPVIFLEKQESHVAKTPSVIDELSVNYSAAMNSGNVASGLSSMANGHNRGGGNIGLNPLTGEFNVGYGQSFKYDVTRIDGLTDVGLNVYSDNYGSSVRTNDGPDYATLVSTLEFNRRGGGSGYFGSHSNTPFNFGGINDDELTTDLGGLMNTFGNDPIMTNPMSGVGYRVKKLEEGEKVVEIKNNELNAYVNSTTIEQQERELEERLCFLAGFPATFITGRSGGKTGGGGGGKSSGSGSKGASSNGASGQSAVSTASDVDNARGFLIGRVRHHKTYYEQQIRKMFLKCYASAFIKSKVKLLKQLDESHWFILEQVYALRVDLPVDPPPMDTSSLMNGFGSGLVTVEEVIRNARLNLGLSLNVMNDPAFMAQAKKKLENKCDPESQLKLQQKYANSSQPGGAGGSGNDKGKKKSKSASVSSAAAGKQQQQQQQQTEKKRKAEKEKKPSKDSKKQKR